LLLLSDALRRRVVADERPFDALPSADDHVILAGYGRFGQIVARVLKLKKVQVTALDLDPAQVDVIRRFGFEIYYGDAARVDLLRAAGAERARLFVLAIDDPAASVRTAEVVREGFPGLRMVARARNREHAHKLVALGVEHVVRETYASSLEAAAIALEEIGFPGGQASAAVDRFRQYDEQLLQEQLEFRDDEDDERYIARTRHFTKELEQIFEQDQQAET
jgi:voltage-gated potassium channel Kch